MELAPTADQRHRLGMHAGLSRVVENFCLELIKAALNQREAEKTYGIPEAELTKVPWSAPALESAWRAAHPERYPWFTTEALSSRVPKEACRSRAAGFRNFFAGRSGSRRGRRMGFPAWRKRRNGGKFRYDADRSRPLGVREAHLPGIGSVPTREDMSWLVEKISTGKARILGAAVKERAGRWWIAFQVDVDRTDLNSRRRAPHGAPACGVDLGIKTFATIVDDTGEVTEVHAPKPLKAAQRALRRASKALSRSQPNSANRVKKRARLANLHLKVASRRADFLHKTTTELTRTKSAVAVETLNVAGLIKNRRLARVISDAGFGEFARQLQYKGEWYGCRVWTADRWFPSSKTCSSCGHNYRGLSLAERVWTCSNCGVMHDRDINAAANLLAAMLSDQA